MLKAADPCPSQSPSLQLGKPISKGDFHDFIYCILWLIHHVEKNMDYTFRNVLSSDVMPKFTWRLLFSSFIKRNKNRSVLKSDKFLHPHHWWMEAHHLQRRVKYIFWLCCGLWCMPLHIPLAVGNSLSCNVCKISWC